MSPKKLAVSTPGRSRKRIAGKRGLSMLALAAVRQIGSRQSRVAKPLAKLLTGWLVFCPEPANTNSC